MSGNVRRNLAVQLTAGGTNPLVLKPKGVLPFKMGTAVNMALVAQGGTAPYAYSITSGALPTAATFTASISTTTMTVTAVANGTIYAGMPVKGTGVTAGQTVISFGTGTGGTGTYTVGISNTLTSRAMTGTLLLAAATGLITGTPSVAGAFTFGGTVQDGLSTIFTGNFEMPIGHILYPIAANPPNGEVGLNYSYQFTVGGNTGAVTWAKTSGTLPPGVSLASSGLLSGLALSAGTATFTLSATDAGTGDVLSQTFVVPIANALVNVGVGTLDGGVVSVGTNYTSIPAITTGLNSVNGQFTGGVAPYRYAFDLTNIPWATGNQTTGQISGTPNVITGSSYVTYAVTIYDAMGAVNAVTVKLRVVAPNQQLQPKRSGGAVGVAGVQELDFSGIGASSLTSDNTTATVTLGANMSAPTTDVTIPASSSAVVVRKLTIASGKKVTIGSGGILRIL